MEDPEEQEVISLARQMREMGLSMRRIAHELTEAGHTPKGGGAWHAQQIGRILAPRE